MKFQAYDLRLLPLPDSQGGGFRLTMDISEDQYEEIKDINDPKLKGQVMVVEITNEVGR